MTPVEFKNWFDGYTEQIVGAPSVGQWVRIVEQFQKVVWSAVTLGGIPNGNPLAPPYRIKFGMQAPYSGDAVGCLTTAQAEKKVAEMRDATARYSIGPGVGSVLGRQISLTDTDVTTNGATD